MYYRQSDKGISAVWLAQYYLLYFYNKHNWFHFTEGKTHLNNKKMIFKMDDATECEFFVITWIIDNFSYWNSEIHEDVLTTEAFRVFRKSNARIELQPRGNGDRVVMRFCGFGQGLSCCLFFIGPDESLIFTQEITSADEEDGDVLEFPPGPKFEDLVSQIESIKEVEHKNRLVLKLRFYHEGNVLLHMHTRLDVFETSMNVSFSSLNDVEVIDAVSVVEYPLNDGRMESVRLDVYSDPCDSSKVLLAVEPESFHEKFALLTFTSVLMNRDGCVLKTEKNSRVFEGRTKWVFSSALTRKEITEKDISLTVNFKIIPSNGFTLLSSHFSTQSKEVRMTPTMISSIPSSGKEHSSESADTSVPDVIKPETSVDALTKEMMFLFQDNDFSDLTLRCGTVSFPTHKNILSTRSPVFKSLLSSNAKKPHFAGSVDIEDLDPPTLARFLTFLYTGNVEDLQWESALKLYYAADKYEVPTLRRECAVVLSASLSIANACDVLSLADRLQDEQLRSVSHAFILKNYNELLGSQEWRDFMKSEPLLAAETVTHIAEKIHERE